MVFLTLFAMIKKLWKLTKKNDEQVLFYEGGNEMYQKRYRFFVGFKHMHFLIVNKHMINNASKNRIVDKHVGILMFFFDTF